MILMAIHRVAFQMIIISILSYANISVNDYTKDKEYMKQREFHKNITSNWTTCEEFLNNTVFDINSVVDIDWQIFYFWDYRDEYTYNIRFSFPTPILIDRFEVGLKDMDLNVNWSQAVLFMETSADFSALYISTSTSGKFQLIPSLAFQTERVPKLIFGLKLVDPGYLGIMNCEQKLCYALAPSDKLPKKENITLAAEKIGFRGSYNYSYLFEKDTSVMDDQPNADIDDNEDDEEIEIENQLDEL